MKDKNKVSDRDALMVLSRLTAKRTVSKYRAKRTANGDGTFSDSKKEARIDAQFMALQKSGYVRVVRKERFPMIINGIKICTYESDWTVYYKNGNREVYDAKGFKTPIYRIKKKLMKALFNIEIQEV